MARGYTGPTLTKISAWRGCSPGVAPARHRPSCPQFDETITFQARRFMSDWRTEAESFRQKQLRNQEDERRRREREERKRQEARAARYYCHVRGCEVHGIAPLVTTYGGGDGADTHV